MRKITLVEPKAIANGSFFQCHSINCLFVFLRERVESMATKKMLCACISQKSNKLKFTIVCGGLSVAFILFLEYSDVTSWGET